MSDIDNMIADNCQQQLTTTGEQNRQQQSSNSSPPSLGSYTIYSNANTKFIPPTTTTTTSTAITTIDEKQIKTTTSTTGTANTTGSIKTTTKLIQNTPHSNSHPHHPHHPHQQQQNFFGLFLKVIFSTPGLILLVIAYSLIGAFMFPLLEAPQDINKLDMITKSREDCLKELWIITGE